MFPMSVAYNSDPGDIIEGTYLIETIVRVQVYSHVVAFEYPKGIAHFELSRIHMIRSHVVQALIVVSYLTKALVHPLECRREACSILDILLDLSPVGEFPFTRSSSFF